MRRVVVSSVACSAVPYSSTLCEKGTIFEKKKVIEHKTCLLIFPITFVFSIYVLRRTERDITYKFTQGFK